MLLIIMELCKVCSQEKSPKKRLELKERIALAKHQLMMEAAGEYRCELEMEPEGASDDFFELKGFMNDCELYCYECTRGIGERAKVYLVIDEYLRGDSDDCKKINSEAPAVIKNPAPKGEEDSSKECQAVTPSSVRPKVCDMSSFRSRKK
ncbi:hypothetical protein HGA34_05355 [Candidatus Falkowbacteria bacterium]|nr:hypothetical protein [Candidatus Falkowbacteria bacterium]